MKVWVIALIIFLIFMSIIVVAIIVNDDEINDNKTQSVNDTDCNNGGGIYIINNSGSYCEYPNREEIE